MDKKQTLSFCLILAVAILINLSGEYLIHKNFNQNQSSHPVTKNTSPLKEVELFDSNNQPEEAHPKIDIDLLAMASAEEEVPTNKKDTQPENEIILKSDQPGKLKSDIQAAPIKQNNEKWLKELIKKELPEITKEEQQIWLEELSDLPLRSARDLLIMRKKVGMIPFQSEVFNQENEISVEKQLANKPPETILSKQAIPSNLQQQSFINNSLKSLNLATNIVLNNIANASTNGFKRSEPILTTMPYQQLAIPSQDARSGSITPINISSGLGVKLVGTNVDFSQGNLRQTNSQLDLAITGEGFFPVSDGTTIYYTRDGCFTTNSDGNLLLAKSNKGYLLEPTINVPSNTIEISVSSDGVVSIKQSGSTATTEIGQLQLVRFTNPKGLIPIRENLYEETSSSGTPLLGIANTEGRGIIHQSFLEVSNVNLADEKLLLQKLKQNINTLKEAALILSYEPVFQRSRPTQTAAKPLEKH
jgi:flagellar basal-body rod protein FlgG